jgi:hypothetical protein
MQLLFMSTFLPRDTVPSDNCCVSSLLVHQVSGKPPGSCMDTYWVMAVIFGGVQMLTSQLPNLEAAWWTSLIGAAMSFG